MAFKRKFSLRAIFVLMTVVIVMLAFGQWRRQRILKEVRSLEAAGVNVMLKQGWWTSVWLPSPTSAQLNAEEVATDRIQMGKTTCSMSDIDLRLKKYRRNLDRLGVTYFLVELKRASGARQQILFDLSKGEEVCSQFLLNVPGPPELIPGN